MSCNSKHARPSLHSLLHSNPGLTVCTEIQDTQRYLAGSLLQVIPGICVLQLDCLDSTQVEEVSTVLGVTAALLRSLSLGPEFLCL